MVDVLKLWYTRCVPDGLTVTALDQEGDLATVQFDDSRTHVSDLLETYDGFTDVIGPSEIDLSIKQRVLAMYLSGAMHSRFAKGWGDQAADIMLSSGGGGTASLTTGGGGDVTLEVRI